MRSTATQICPALANAPSAAWAAAHAGSTPASTMSGSLPPFSSSTLAPVCAAAAAIERPAAVEPTCATTSTADSASAAPVGPAPASIDSTPGGKCGASSPVSCQPVAGVRSLGLYTTVLPVARAAPSSPQETATG